MKAVRIAVIVVCALGSSAQPGCTTSDSDGGADGSSGDMDSSTSTSTSTPTTSGADTVDSTGADPFDHEPVCSSGKSWTMGNQESPAMHPGVACLACHKTQEPEIAGRLAIAGTVYPTAHEPDDCYGVDDAGAPVLVEITTADARVINLPVNAAGNFMYDREEQGDAITFPITARVLQGERVRVMASPQATGDCNSCHTQVGTSGAPGRIIAP